MLPPCYHRAGVSWQQVGMPQHCVHRLLRVTVPVRQAESINSRPSCQDGAAESVTACDADMRIVPQ